jgi:hypothetical protein
MMCSSDKESKKSIHNFGGGRSLGTWPLERPRQKWDYNININLRNINCEDMNWLSIVSSGRCLTVGPTARATQIYGYFC